MTKEEIDELGSMAMKVINEHPLTAEEEERFKELQEKLDGMAETASCIKKELDIFGSSATQLDYGDSDVSSPKLEG